MYRPLVNRVWKRSFKADFICYAIRFIPKLITSSVYECDAMQEYR